MTQLSINYAKVLYELPVPKEDVLQSETILKQVPELLSVFTSPVILEKKKFVLIDRIFPESIRRFFKVMCRNQAMDAFWTLSQSIKNITAKSMEFCWL